MAVRDAMTIEERQIASLCLTERILGHQWFYRAELVLCFASFGSEIDTTEILKEALRLGKEVYVPRVEGDEMQFYRIRSIEELQPGYRGILEPSKDTERFVYETVAKEERKLLLLMPGVAFDRYRNRLGYGKGFYDRYLQDKPLLVTYSIGIGFACQLVEHLPSEETDIRPYQVLTL